MERGGVPESLTYEIATAVAAAEGVELSELDLTLRDHVNPDALEALAAHENSTWTLQFELPDHTVTVTSDGVVCVDSSVEEFERVDRR